MATRVDLRTDCDLCARAQEGAKEPAATTRPAPPEFKAEGDTIDLCGFCAVVYDIAMPRYDELRRRVEVLPEVLASAQPQQTTAPPKIVRQVREKGQQERPAAAQLSIVSDDQPPQPEASQAPPVVPSSERRNHQNDEIVCHDCEPPRRLAYKMRTRHAGNVHGCKSWEIRWRLPDGELLPYRCEKHEQCSASNYGFLAASGLTRHETEGGKGLIPWQDDDEPEAEAAAEPVQTSMEPTPDPNSASLKRRGYWVEGVDQVGCPLDHDLPGAAVPYFVDWAKRNDHARRAHKLRVDEIDWFTKDGDKFQLKHVCGVCGVGFPTEASLDHHFRSMKTTPNPSHQKKAA